jgi:hypothetical protein
MNDLPDVVAATVEAVALILALEAWSAASLVT